jgi:uncharacterized protein YkwD
MRFSPRLMSLAAGGALLFSTTALHAVLAQDKPAVQKFVVTAPSDLSQIHETDEEQQFVDLVNKERGKRGLSHLTLDPLLIETARLHSAEMRDKSYFNHESPTPGLKTPMDRYLKVVGSAAEDPRFYACVGENLFWSTVTDVTRGHQAFMNSPTHRENLLYPRYEKIGVGIVKKDNGEFWVTEMFVTNADPKSVAKRMAKGR